MIPKATASVRAYVKWNNEMLEVLNLPNTTRNIVSPPNPMINKEFARKWHAVYYTRINTIIQKKLKIPLYFYYKDKMHANKLQNSISKKNT